MTKWTFQAQPDVFIDIADIQDDYPEGKVSTQPNLGLIPGQAYPSDDLELPDQRDWVRLERYVKWLNERAAEGVRYKVLYLTRHGLGYHNKLHKEVGHEAWEHKWSFEYGNETETWFDAQLTEVGVQQAKDLNAFWTNLTTLDGAPLPSIIYTSPLTRCLQTTHHIFRPLIPPSSFIPIIKEGLRERITLHQCDFRHPRSWIAAQYPDYCIEDGFAEEDGYAGRTVAETDAEHEARKQRVLEELWDGDSGVFLGLTVHSYAIRAVQAVCGLRECRTREGTSLAILVRGERGE